METETHKIEDSLNGLLQNISEILGRPHPIVGVPPSKLIQEKLPPNSKILSKINLKVADIDAISSTFTTIVLDRCTSREWLKIGHLLGTRASLTGLIAGGCDFGDDLFPGLYSSPTIKTLKIG